MVLSAAALLALLRCAPTVAPATMAAVVAQESGWHAYAIDDNTARRRYYPRSALAARRLAVGLLAHGHRIDVGYAGIDSDNFAAFGLTAANAFDPCTNLHVGAAILTADYLRARQQYPANQALGAALEAYNSGHFLGAPAYARAVLARALGVHVAIARPARTLALRAIPLSPLSATRPAPAAATLERPNADAARTRRTMRNLELAQFVESGP